MHIPVLLEPAVRLWASLDKSSIAKPGIYIDATFGKGGHSQFLLELPALTKGSIVIGIDWDNESIQKSKTKYQKFIQEKRLFLFHDNYTNLDKIVSSFQKTCPESLRRKQKTKLVLSPATKCGINSAEGLPVRGVLFDFGLRTDQLAAMRGFSFMEPEAPLDMRFDREYNEQTAIKILNTWTEEQLITIFRDYGEERYSRKVAREILAARINGNEFKTVSDLLDALKKAIAPAYARQKIHYATRIFQALRIAVNREEENIHQGLTAARDILVKEGRIVAISFHSGEDRIVKNFFRDESKDCLCPPQLPQCVCGHRKGLRIITKKPIAPNQEETNKNPNARSAKMRVAEKI